MNPNWESVGGVHNSSLMCLLLLDEILYMLLVNAPNPFQISCILHSLEKGKDDTLEL